MEITRASFELNCESCEEFIKQADPKVKVICRKIIDNTLYVDYVTFTNSLNRIIDNFLDFYITKNNLKPIFFYSYENEKFKSNYWVLSYVIEYINQKKPEIEIILVDNLLNQSKLKENDIIVFVDDCIYLGEQMSITLNELEKFHKKYKFYILVPYMSLVAKTKITEIFNNDTINVVGKIRARDNENIIFPTNFIEIPPIKNYLNKDESKILESFYNEGEDHEPFIDAKNTYLVYFEHKLADKDSVPTIFYLGIVPNEKNSFILNGLEDENDIDKKKEKLTIIPIINTCNKINKLKIRFNLASPQCPYPPYKKSYSDFKNELEKLGLQPSFKGGKRILKKYS